MAKIIREVKNSSDNFDNLLRYNRDVIFDGNEKEEAFEDGIERGFKKGVEHGIKHGIKQGIKQKTIEDAKAMFRENCDVDLICRVTKLSAEEVQKIKEEL